MIDESLRIDSSAQGEQAVVQARRSWPRIGRRQNSGSRPQGSEVALRRQAQAVVRGRPDALAAAVAQAGLRSPRKRVKYQVVKVGQLERVEGDEATPETMKAAGLIKSLRRPVKVLGDGDIARALKVTANAFSRTAREKIEKAGGAVSEAE